MKSGPVIHGILLVVALIVSYQTWTREDTPDPQLGDVTVWDKNSSDFESMEYETENRTLKVTYRDDKAGRYLWGEVVSTKTVKKPKPKPEPEPTPSADAGATDDAAPASADAAAGSDAGSTPPTPEPAKPDAAEEEEEIVTTTTREFPLGERGEELVKNLSSLQALRDLGKLPEEQAKEFGLADSTSRLRIWFKGEAQPREFVIGNRVYARSDVYATDTSSDISYVFSNKIINDLSAGENVLALRKLHEYDKDEVTIVLVETEAGEKALIKGEKQDESGTRTTWAYKEKPLEPDQTLNNVLSRLERLTPSEYKPNLDPATLTRVAKLTFKGPTGELGFVELYLQPEGEAVETPEPATPHTGATDKPGEPVWYVRSEETHVLAKVSKFTARTVHQDLNRYFGAPEPPAAPTPPPTPKPTPSPHGAPPPGGDPHGHGAPPPGGDPHGHGAPGGAAPPAGGKPAPSGRNPNLPPTSPKPTPATPKTPPAKAGGNKPAPKAGAPAKPKPAPAGTAGMQ